MSVNLKVDGQTYENATGISVGGKSIAIEEIKDSGGSGVGGTSVIFDYTLASNVSGGSNGVYISIPHNVSGTIKSVSVARKEESTLANKPGFWCGNGYLNMFSYMVSGNATQGATVELNSAFSDDATYCKATDSTIECLVNKFTEAISGTYEVIITKE